MDFHLRHQPGRRKQLDCKLVKPGTLILILNLVFFDSGKITFAVGILNKHYFYYSINKDVRSSQASIFGLLLTPKAPSATHTHSSTKAEIPICSLLHHHLLLLLHERSQFPNHENPGPSPNPGPDPDLSPSIPEPCQVSRLIHLLALSHINPPPTHLSPPLLAPHPPCVLLCRPSLRLLAMLNWSLLRRQIRPLLPQDKHTLTRSLRKLQYRYLHPCR